MAEIILPGDGRPYLLVRAEGENSPLDLAADRIVDWYKTHGALLLRGFAADLDGFREFAGTFCIDATRNESRGRDLLDPTHNIQSVNRGTAPFPLHPELSREPWRPDVCFFGCLNPPRADGATTLCDGVGIVEQMPAQLRAALAERRLLYALPATPDELAYWLGAPDPDDAALAAPPPHCPYFFRRTPHGVVRAFTRPALHRPMFTDALAFGNFLLFARYRLGMTGFPLFEDGSPVPDALVDAVDRVAAGLTAGIAWQRGDLLMIDNSRFMHGRTAVRDSGARLIASYFGYLKFARPDPEEPADPPWRRGAFQPPLRMAPAG